MAQPAQGEDAPGGAALTLYCLAHAGGSPLPYARWTKFLPPTVRIHPLELPGHGSRLREPVHRRMDDLVAGLVRAVRAEGTEQFALFGHSFGALLAFELAHRLNQLGSPPSGLFVAGRNGPLEPLAHRPIHTLPEEEFLGALGRHGGLPEALLSHRELLRMYLPALRADMTLTETYTRTPGPALDLPVVAYAGRRDTLTDSRGVLGWERETTEVFDLSLLPGGHFFLEGQDFKDSLAVRLARMAPAPAEAQAPAPGQAAAGSPADAPAKSRANSPLQEAALLPSRR